MNTYPTEVSNAVMIVHKRDSEDATYRESPDNMSKRIVRCRGLACSCHIARKLGIYGRHAHTYIEENPLLRLLACND